MKLACRKNLNEIKVYVSHTETVISVCERISKEIKWKICSFPFLLTITVHGEAADESIKFFGLPQRYVTL